VLVDACHWLDHFSPIINTLPQERRKMGALPLIFCSKSNERRLLLVVLCAAASNGVQRVKQLETTESFKHYCVYLQN